MNCVGPTLFLRKRRKKFGDFGFGILNCFLVRQLDLLERIEVVVTLSVSELELEIMDSDHGLTDTLRKLL